MAQGENENQHKTPADQSSNAFFTPFSEHSPTIMRSRENSLQGVRVLNFPGSNAMTFPCQQEVAGIRDKIFNEDVADVPGKENKVSEDVMRGKNVPKEFRFPSSQRGRIDQFRPDNEGQTCLVIGLWTKIV